MIFLRHKLLAAVALAGISILPMATALTSCRRAPSEASIAARVGNAVLTDEEISRIIPFGLSTDDSIATVNDYIDIWIVNRLVSDIAAKNIHNLEEIDRLTEEYRRNLIMEEYRRLKIEQDTSLAVTQTQIEDFYANYGGEMRLEEPMIKGIYIAVSKNSPQLPGIRRWYKSTKAADIEKLEKVGLTEAVNYEYFRNNWMPVSHIADRIPGKPHPEHKGQTIEVSDDATTYLLSISDYLPEGASMPLSAAAPGIRERLETIRANEIDRMLRNKLYDKAISDGTAWRRDTATK